MYMYIYIYIYIYVHIILYIYVYTYTMKHEMVGNRFGLGFSGDVFASSK